MKQLEVLKFKAKHFNCGNLIFIYYLLFRIWISIRWVHLSAGNFFDDHLLIPKMFKNFLGLIVSAFFPAFVMKYFVKSRMLSVTK